VEKAEKKLKQAKEHHKWGKKCKCIAIIVGLVILVIVIIVIATTTSK
jgi:flagellar basal body-associated protein FliL